MSDPRVRRAETVLFLGESHTLSFGERVVERGDAPPLVCQPLFIANAVSLANLTLAAGKLNPNVRVALRGSLVGILATDDLAWRRVARRRFLAPPMLVLALGSYDVFQSIQHFPGDDFVLPQTPYLHAPPESAEFAPLPNALDADRAMEYFTAVVEPYREGLGRLRELGFRRLATLAIPPPTPDDEKARRSVAGLGGVGSPAKLRRAFRYKSALVLNALIAQACLAENVEFLDSWPLLATDAKANEGVLGDAAYLSDAAIEEVLLCLIVPAAERTALVTA